MPETKESIFYLSGEEIINVAIMLNVTLVHSMLFALAPC